MSVRSNLLASRLGHFWVAVLILVMHTAMFWFYWVPEPRGLRGDESTYLKTAMAWLQGGPAFVDSLWPPGYLWFLTSLQGNLVWVQGVQYALLLTVAGLAGRICTHLTGSAKAGLVTVLALLLYPPLVAYAQFLWPELLHLAVMLASWFCLLKLRDSHFPFLLVVLGGLFLGLALLLKSVTLVFLPFLVLLVVSISRNQRIRNVLGFLVAIALIVAPVMWGKYQQTGVPYLHTSGLFNVQLGLENTARQWHKDRMGGRVWREYRDLGDNTVERNAALKMQLHTRLQDKGYLQTALHMLLKQPFRMLDIETEFTVGRGYATKDDLLFQMLAWWSRAWYLIFIVCIPLALVQWPRTHKAWWLPVSFALVVCGLLLIMHAKPRFRIVWIPGMTMVVAHALVLLQQQDWRSELSKMRPWQWLLVAMATIIILFFATAAPIMDALFPLGVDV
jgi:hypothetical protein